MKRREVTKAAAYSWIGLHFGLLAGCGDGDDSVSDRSRSPGEALRDLQDLAAGLRGVDFVGPVCFRRLQVEDPLQELLSSLALDTGPLVAALRNRIAGDFQEGRVVDINGWKLSEGECLLLAGAAELQGLAETTELTPQPFAQESFMEIAAWGPDQTLEGEIFNPIGNGRGGFWMRISSPVNGSMRLVLDGRELATHFEPGLITASLEPDYMERIISAPGVHELVLIDKSKRLRQSVGFLTVAARPNMAVLADGSPSEAFCEVGRWGPTSSVQGEAFNRQPSGSAAFWVRIGCAPKDSVLTLDGIDLPTTVQGGLVTAGVAHYADLERGEHALAIRDPSSGEKLTIGNLLVQ